MPRPGWICGIQCCHCFPCPHPRVHTTRASSTSQYSKCTWLTQCRVPHRVTHYINTQPVNLIIPCGTDLASTTHLGLLRVFDHVVFDRLDAIGCGFALQRELAASPPFVSLWKCPVVPACTHREHSLLFTVPDIQSLLWTLHRWHRRVIWVQVLCSS